MWIWLSVAQASEPFERWGERPRDPALEVNVLWPFFPGGISDVKLVAPLLRPQQDAGRGEGIAGLHSDFGWGPLTRPVDSYGKVRFLGVKLGWRQFVAWGLHLDLTANVGWRHEEGNVYDGTTLDSLNARAWTFAGWQVDLTERVYTNVRGGVGVHLIRVGDPYADTERPLAPGGDWNIGVRF
ncbi:MAG: hypothetical protein ABMA64_17965 [Myxococcota bacterium]